MATGGTPGDAQPLSPQEVSDSYPRDAVRRPETPAERHARRKAWGAMYGPLMRAVITPQIQAYDRHHAK